MSIGFSGLVDVVASHAMGLGVFVKVNQHEPKTAPDNGVSAAIWVQSIGPAESGLASTSIRLVLTVRVFASFISEPQDAIDPAVVDAVDALMAAYSGDFQLSGLVRQIDLLGRGGEPLSARAGYLNQDNKIFRIMDVTLPLILNDVWQQVA